MGQDKLNFDRPEEEIIAEYKAQGVPYYYKPVSWFKIGHYVDIDEHVCKVSEITTGKKHGKLGRNICIAGHDVFTGEKREKHVYESYNVMCPFVEYKEYLVINLPFEGTLTLMNEESNEQKEDVEMPEGDLGIQLREAFNADDVVVTVVNAWRKESIVKFRRKSE